MSTLNISFFIEDRKDIPIFLLILRCDEPISSANYPYLEQNFPGPKDVRAIEVELYVCVIMCTIIRLKTTRRNLINKTWEKIVQLDCFIDDNSTLPILPKSIYFVEKENCEKTASAQEYKQTT